MNEQLLQNILDNAIDGKKIFGTSFCLKYKGATCCGASGDMQTNSRYFIASTTKMYVTAIILNLRSAGKIKLEEKIAQYLPKEIVDGLHIINGRDYSYKINIRNLLAHTSGIPDYFQKKDSTGNSLETEITSGRDRLWNFSEAVALSKTHKPPFIPDAKGKAHYSDTNYQLLGHIIQAITGKSFAEVLQEVICKPLGLVDTHLFQKIDNASLHPLYFKNKKLNIPKAMASFGPDGGIVSTSQELMFFLEAFFRGTLFPQTYVSELMDWNRIFFPMQSGVGIHRFKLPWILNPLGSIPELLGHSGLSGTLAFHNPEKDLFITGTVNQVAYPDTSFRLAIKIIQKLCNN